jgi:hypothetical protein
MKRELKKVRVIRHTRNEVYDPLLDLTIKSNLGGVTFVFDLDYDARTVAVSFAMAAADENFNKETAIKVAEENGPQRILDLDKFRVLADKVGGFVPALATVLSTAEVNGTPLNKREKVLVKNHLFF